MCQYTEKFVDYFEKSISTEEKIGLELEHFITQNGERVNYSDGISDIVKILSKDAKEVYLERGNILGFDAGNYTITLEPGAQIEISVKPFSDTEKIRETVLSFYDKITPLLLDRKMQMTATPLMDEMNPDMVELLPKERYRYMDKYFQKSGTFGRSMMRSTASCQVSVDYLSEEDFIKKYRLAYILSPFFALFAKGEKPLKRIEIWNNTDNERTKIPDGLFESTFGFLSYAEYILKNKPIFIPTKDGFMSTGDKTCLDILKEDSKDVPLEHFLSMVFPDVRLKKYIEIRIADSMPIDRAIEYAKFIKGIFYSGKIDMLLDRYKDVREEDIKNAKNEILEKGFDSLIYGKNAKDEMAFLKEVAI